MNRRDFLKSLAAVAAIPLAAKPVSDIADYDRVIYPITEMRLNAVQPLPSSSWTQRFQAIFTKGDMIVRKEIALTRTAAITMEKGTESDELNYQLTRKAREADRDFALMELGPDNWRQGTECDNEDFWDSLLLPDMKHVAQPDTGVYHDISRYG